MPTPSCLRAIALLCLAATLAACSPTRDPNLAGPAYPAEKSQTRTLDIQVVRTPTELKLTNTTARAYGTSRLWLNRWYSREIPGLAVGESLTIRLDSFRDIHGEAFRAGGFFATREPQRAELIQLETADGMIGLVAVGKQD